MKKNIRFAMLLGLCGLFFTACEQEEEQQIISGNRFRVEAPKFVDNEKTYLQFTDDLSRIIYEEGDKVYINGVEFTLSKDGDVWWANSSQTVTAPELYVAYADGAVADWNESAHTYSFNLNSTLNSTDHNKVVLCGTARENGYAITLAPACAILRLNTQGAGTGYSYVKVGFDGNRIPKQGTVTPASHTLSASGSQFLAGVTSGGAGEFLYMTHSKSSAGESDYWYVAIPITGSSVTTTLYLEWNNGSETIQHKTQGEVTLEKGKVYTIGTERVSPFYSNGASKSYFKVSNSQQIRFSAGNLQYRRFENTSTGEMEGQWRFADHQFDMIQSGNENIDSYYEGWIDLFGWGTSGWNSGGGAAYEPYATSGTFKPGGSNDADLLGAYANSDWGVYNGPNIHYGSAASGLSVWRTLTDEEWNYLLNSRPSATTKKALATVVGCQGLILLPESWTLPEGLSFTAGTASGYSTNVYTAEQWDKMENAGAIFLPAAGYRNGTSVGDTPSDGYYWSATHNNGMNSKCIHFSSSTIENTTMTRSRGCAVRLVRNR